MSGFVLRAATTSSLVILTKTTYSQSLSHGKEAIQMVLLDVDLTMVHEV